MVYDKRLLVLPFVLCVAGCDGQQGVVQTMPDGRETGIVIYTDKDNGCQYLRPAYHDGFQPRMGKDGKQMCG